MPHPPAAAPILHVTSQRLGAGTSASVHVAHLDGRLVAAKLSGSRESARRQCRREARRYARFRHHRGIVRCLGVGENAGTVVLVTELMSGGSLFDALGAREGVLLPISTALRLALDVSDALAYLHCSGYSCGDVKSLNVLLSASLDNTGALRPGACAKLCDFGLSRRLHGKSKQDAERDADAPGPEFMFQSTIDVDPNAIAGTFAYLAPETFESPPISAPSMVAADVFALAVVLWEIATVQIPWHGHSLGELMRAVRENRRLPWPARVRDKFGEDFIALVERCWHRVPSQRPEMTEVVTTLQKLYDETVPTRHDGKILLNSVPFSDVTDYSARLDDDGALSIFSTNESCAITEIDDEEDGLDGDSFDIPLSLFSYKPQQAPQHDEQEANEGDKDGEGNDAKSDDEYDIYVTGAIEVEEYEIDSLSSMSLSKKSVSFVQQGKRVEHSDVRTRTHRGPSADAGQNATFHVSNASAAYPPLFPKKERRRTKSCDAVCSPKMTDPEMEYDAHPDFLAATNELSEHDFTCYRDKELDSSVESSAAKPVRVFKHNLLDSIQRRPPTSNTRKSPDKKPLSSPARPAEESASAAQARKMHEHHEAEMQKKQQALRRQQDIERQQALQKQRQHELHLRQKQEARERQEQLRQQGHHPMQAYNSPRHRSYKTSALTPSLERELLAMEHADATQALLWSVMKYSTDV